MNIVVATLLVGLGCVLSVAGLPASTTRFTSTTVPTTTSVYSDSLPDLMPPGPEAGRVEGREAVISRFHARTDVRFRYARTVVESYVKNPSTTEARQVDFELVLPEKAFISNLTITTGNRTHVSRVERQEKARDLFREAVDRGQSAGLVDAREGNIFSVRASVAASDKVLFALTYEELLERRLGRYQFVLHLRPQQIVDDLKIDVFINESLPVVNLNVPEIKETSNQVTSDLSENLVAVIEGRNTSQVHVRYAPTPEQQRAADPQKGISGQFIVQYDVDRKNQSSDVQVLDGYLVHFFTPEKLSSLPKHVVFVLDTSGSMMGEKMVQLKDAMVTVLTDLKESDHFSILTFSNGVKHWKSETEKESEKPHLPAHPAKEDLISQAVDFVIGLKADGGTNINDALLEAVDTVLGAQPVLPAGQVTSSLVVFLTDGQPTSGTSNPDEIRANLKDKNSRVGVPIYGLAFGSGADYRLMKDISGDSKAFARKIYAESDATIQLEDFYMEISNPLLDNVTFEYVGESLRDPVENVLPTTCFHSGSEVVMVAKVDLEKDADVDAQLVVRGQSVDGDYEKRIFPCFFNDSDTGFPFLPMPCIPFPMPNRPRPVQSGPENFIERLWAFLTVEKLLDDKADNGDLSQEEREEKAIALALDKNFVTDLTSLVVVKPNSTDQEESVLKLTPVGQKDQMQYASIASGAFPGIFLSKASYPANSPPLSIQRRKMAKGRPRPTTSTPFFLTTTTTAADYFFDVEEDSEESIECLEDECKIELFSKTLLRGQSVELTQNSTDLSPLGFEKRVSSLDIEGQCRWELFKEPNFQGMSMTVHPERGYKSAVNLGKFFRKVASIRLIAC